MVAIAIGMTITNPSAPVSLRAAEVAFKVNSPVATSTSADTGPVEPFAPPVDRQAAAKNDATVAADPAEVANQTQAPPAPAKTAVETVVEIQGIDPAKQVGSFFVSSKEQAALFKKKRNEPGDGVRIDLHRGAELRIQISPNEIVRVAEGRDLGMFYQGRMVPAQIVESGDWVSFVRKTSDTSD
jgi:hypothetical protein